mgnify:CR=1 FL=1|tara:strand:+ start:1868 stop:2131 length:264 start_codon:yes stop_codon:yes gene_type:complete
MGDGLKRGESTVLYTMNGCRYCVLAKELLARANVPYSEVLLDRDMNKQEVKDILRMDVVTFPQVVYNGTNLGGLVEAARYFKSKGMV